MTHDMLDESVAGRKYKFVVKSAEEAAVVIRERLGPGARVLSVRQVEGEGLARFLRAPRLEIVAELPADSADERETVVEPVEAPRETMGARPRTSRRERVWEMLERAGVRADFLARMAHRNEWRDLEAMPAHSALVRAASLLRRDCAPPVRALAKRAVFFGSPGSGATTALCKELAADVFLRGTEACVMKLDGDQPNSIEGLAMFCEALGVPLLRSVAEMAETGDDTVIRFDVPGAIRDTDALSTFSRLLDTLDIESRVLVVNAAYDRDLLQRAYADARTLGGTHVVFTHLDELSRCGKLWEFVLEGSLTPLFASSGANLAGDRDPDVLDLLVRRTIGAACVES